MVNAVMPLRGLQKPNRFGTGTFEQGGILKVEFRIMKNVSDFQLAY